MGPDLTIDLNLARDNPPASIKYMYVGNQNQLNLISITVYFSYFHSLLLTTHVEVFIIRRETVDFPDLTLYK